MNVQKIEFQRKIKNLADLNLKPRENSLAPLDAPSADAKKSHAIPLDDSTSSVPRDAIDSEEVFELIRDINDPEHPLTLEQLKVVSVRLSRAHFNINKSAWNID